MGKISDDENYEKLADIEYMGRTMGEFVRFEDLGIAEWPFPSQPSSR